MAAWGGAFRATRAAWKKRKGPMLMPGLLEAQQLAVARQPERVLRNRGLVEIGQVCLPNALQQSIKAIVAEGATSSAHVHRDVRRLMSAYDAFFSGWPQPSAERLADDTREPPLMREMDVGRIPDARMVRLLRGWEKNSWGKGTEEGGEGGAGEAAERGKGGARERGEGGRRAVEYGETEALAYAAARMPSTYAAVFRALTEVKRRLPSLSPSSLLDFGSGPGTVMWAASEVWGSTVQRAAAVEPADAMWAMGERIRAVAAAGPRPPRALRDAVRYTSLQHLSREARGADRVFDVVVAAYALGEVQSVDERRAIVDRLWSHARHVMVLVETGNPRGYEAIAKARAHILHTQRAKAARLADRGPSKNAPDPSKPLLPPGAHVLAPCAHDGHCPMYGTTSWCHFSQTLQRSAVQRIAKRAAGQEITGSTEDEKFSYVVLRRGPRPLVVAPLQQIAQFRREEKERQAREEAEKEAKRLAKKQAKWGPTVRLIPLDEGTVGTEAGALLQGERQGAEGAGEEGEQAEEEEEEEEEDEDEEEEEEADVRPKHTPVSAPDEEEGVIEGRRDGESDMDGTVTDSSDEDDGDNDDAGLDDDTVDPTLATDNPPRGDRFANLSPEWSRVIREPRRRGQHVIVDVCASMDGRGRRGELQRLLFSKAAERVEYRFARKVRWGDLWPSTGEAQEGKEQGEREGTDTTIMTTSSDTQPQEPAHTGGPEVALVFIGVSLALGALCRQVLSNTRIPYTVALLLVGVGLGALGANIDPELVLYVFLPALLFESAFSFEFHQVKRCLVQMFLLAVPGVAISTGFLGVISRYVLPYGWNWSTAMLLGGLLSATDPVAVVALLRDLGASKKLSTIIDGEALMNDGTAIVVFQLFLRLTLGYSYGIGDVIGFLFKVTLGGVGLGMAFGVVSLLWLRTVFSDHVIEITISLTASYMAFFVVRAHVHAAPRHTHDVPCHGVKGMPCHGANDVAQTSGVLSDMTLGMDSFTSHSILSLLPFSSPPLTTLAPDPYGSMFAIFAKTAFTGESEQGMHHFWEMVSYIANTLIFVLSGVVISESILQNANYIKGADWGYMILLYVFVQLSRVVVVGVLYPGLASSGYGLTWKEAIILVWSGLRGAVALTLALVVSHEPVTENITKETEARFMFLTGGVVFLTLIVNGSTTQFVLAALKMNATSDIKKRVVNFTRQELCEYAVKTFEEIGDDEELGPAEWATVNEYLTCLKQPASHGTLSASAFLSRFGGSGTGSGGGSGVGVRKSHPHDHSQSHEQLRAQQLHDTRLRFLNGVQAAYWSMLEEGRVNQTAAMLLMQAVAEAVDLTTQQRRLLLWKALEPHVCMPRYLRLFHRRLRRLLPQRALNWVTVDRLELAASMSAAYIRALRNARQQLRDFLKDSPICEAVILESEEEETPAKRFMEDVRLNFPEVLTIIKTKQVTHAILQGLHGYVENLEHAGLLDQREVMHLHKAVQADMKKLHRSPPFVAMLPAGEVLARQPLIGALPADIRLALLQPLKEATKLSGASLFHEGQPAQGVWLIASGTAKWTSARAEAEAEAHGHRFIPPLFAHGSSVGLYETLRGCAYMSTVAADSVLHCFFIDRQRIMDAAGSSDAIEDFLWKVRSRG
ncbi:unnamed protein product [Closterium sp. NIES-64]|nr:unnamed protein product [Closterium sp. NIES-64]